MNKIEPLRRVAQRNWDAGDCGLVCVAMVGKVPYEKVLATFRKLPGKDKTSSFYTGHHHLEKMLKMLGYPTRRLRFTSWHEIEHHAIVKVHLKKNGTWHWVVYDAGRPYPAVHDPKPRKRRIIRDFRGLRASGHYIAVTR